MDGVHDMGGMHGFGPIPIDENEPLFAEEWQGRVFAENLALTVPLGANVDRFRFLIDSMPPAQYLSVSYYERWLASILSSVSEHQLLNDEQLSAILSGEVPDVAPTQTEALPPEIVGMLVNAPTGTRRDMTGEAIFQAGDRVRARTIHPEGHTRLPRYVRGHIGTICKDNGNHHLPDTRAMTGNIEMQRLYTVSFRARELWGEKANPQDTVNLDLWESYLEPT
jgi:nitrile hydratase beta subunit